MKKFVFSAALLAFMAIAAQAQTITFGAPISSFPTNGSLPSNSTLVKLTYAMTAPGALFVGCATNTYIASKTTAVYINGAEATEVGRLAGLSHQTDTTLWYSPNVPAGPASIMAQSSSGATHGYGLQCFAEAAYGVNPTDPIDSSYTVNTPSLGSGGVKQATCAFTPWTAGGAFLTYEYSTAYNTSTPTLESFAPSGGSAVDGLDLTTNRFSGLQMAFAHGSNLTLDKPYSQTWTFNNSHTSVQVSIITVLLKP